MHGDEDHPIAGANATAASKAGAAPDEATEKRMNRRLKPIWRIETDPANGEGGDGGGDGGKPATFTQEEVDRIVSERLKREREATKTKYADYDDLKAKAEGAKSTEERMTGLEKQLAATQHEALRARVQAAHGISDEDAALFLNGTDEETLTAQAKRLAARGSERKQKNNVSPREGNHPKFGGTDDMREFARGLFARAQQD